MIRKKINLLYLVFGLIFLSLSSSTNGQKSDIFVKDRPENPRMAVNDFASVFNPIEKESIERKLRNFYDTSNVEIHIITLKTIDSFPIEDVCIAYWKKWTFGSKELNNGILILLSINPRKIRISTGVGIEDVLEDSICVTILKQEMIPLLKEGQFFEAFDNGTSKIMMFTSEKFRNKKPKKLAA